MPCSAARYQRLVVVPSLEIPVVLIAPGLGATEAVLEELDPSTDCRLRSLRFFSPGTRVHYTLTSDALGGGKLHVYGRIAGYETKPPRFIYHVVLDAMTRTQAERVAASVAERRLQLAAGRSRDLLADTVHSPPLARASVRAEADFDLDYRRGEVWRRATAQNLSTGGMLMRARDVLMEGMAVDLRLLLPSEILEVAVSGAIPETLWDPAVRQAAQAMLRRPFKDLIVRGRVVCHRPIAGTIVDYGIEFCDLGALARSEIERFCAALHVAKGDVTVSIAEPAAKTA